MRVLGAVRKYILYIFIPLLAGCRCGGGGVFPDDGATADLDSLKSRGTLRVAINYNSVNYFEHKGKAMGLQYELAEHFAKELGLALDVLGENRPAEAAEMLRTGQADMLAQDFLLADGIAYDTTFMEPTTHHTQSRLVVVRNKRSPASKGATPDTVCVREGSPYMPLVERMADSCGIRVMPIEYYDTEQIVQLVADGELPAALTPEGIARANLWYYPDLEIASNLTPYTPVVWMVRRTSPGLKAAFDKWMTDFRNTGVFKRLYGRYVVDAREQKNVPSSTSADTYEDTYREIILRHIDKESPYDLALVSSVIFQESHFKNDIKSWAGASGLMQLMPETALRFGVSDLADPEQNIKAGVGFLLWLDSRMVKYVPDRSERVKFTLAAYNAGLGHIMDAIRLAAKYGKRADIWEGNTEGCLLMKANPAVVADRETVKHGFCRGSETVNYVHQVLERYKNYKKVVPAESGAAQQ